jgi:hypothetical protein
MERIVANSDVGPVTASPDQRAVVARALITISLAAGTLGLGIPFGSASGPESTTITPLEWIISILAIIGALGLLVDFLHPWRSILWRTAFAEMAVGFLWISSAVYELIVPSDASVQWRVAHALMYAGYAVLALTTWRWINRGRIRR